MKGEIQCSVAYFALNEMVMLKVAGSYCLKCARFVQCQIKVLLCMPACNFLLADCICANRLYGVCCK